MQEIVISMQQWVAVTCQLMHISRMLCLELRCVITFDSDSKAAPLCMVEGGTVMRMLEFFRRIHLCQSLAGGRQLGDSQSQTIRKIQQVFGEDAMGVTQIKEWFNRFKDGRTSAESEQRCGRP
ncbi:hypothetical protein ANN_02399 [Periplaneta americana]|uniref:Mos1 transposase HTH domain-containing protein n=1 Tax=Periplaneta americana TaxID=6978 RepID=A0ABQ8TZM8_PERAM|nr:hypothetical protein ANN_02399 [Periplaneta americana]